MPQVHKSQDYESDDSYDTESIDQKFLNDMKKDRKSPEISDLDSISSHHEAKKRKSALFRKETFYGASDEYLYEDSHLKEEVD